MKGTMTSIRMHRSGDKTISTVALLSYANAVPLPTIVVQAVAANRELYPCSLPIPAAIIHPHRRPQRLQWPQLMWLWAASRLKHHLPTSKMNCITAQPASQPQPPPSSLCRMVRRNSVQIPLWACRRRLPSHEIPTTLSRS